MTPKGDLYSEKYMQFTAKGVKRKVSYVKTSSPTMLKLYMPDFTL